MISLLRRLLEIAVLVGVPLGSIWVMFGDYIPEIERSPREAGAEETPFIVTYERYRDIYVRDGEWEDRLRQVWGRVPFDLPSAFSCLTEPLVQGAQPVTQKLAWEKIASIEALEVCLSRVLHRFDDGDPAVEWLLHQGFRLKYRQQDELCPGERMYFEWAASAKGGPDTFWQSLSWLDRFSHTGIVMTVTICRRASEYIDGLVLTGQPPPYFDVRPRLNGKWQK